MLIKIEDVGIENFRKLMRPLVESGMMYRVQIWAAVDF